MTLLILAVGDQKDKVTVDKYGTNECQRMSFKVRGYGQMWGCMLMYR